MAILATIRPMQLLRPLAIGLVLLGTAAAEESQKVQHEINAVDSDLAVQQTPDGGVGNNAKINYVIGPEDVLAVNVWREPEISRAVPVRPDGKISLPLIGEVVAEGLTPRALEANIIKQLGAYLSNPEVTVIVQEMKSSKFSIVGEVLRPGTYILTSTMTVLDGLALGGGFREFAKPNKIYVLRVQPDGTRVRLPFKYKDVIKGQRFNQNVDLKPHDTIVVP